MRLGQGLEEYLTKTAQIETPVSKKITSRQQTIKKVLTPNTLPLQAQPQKAIPQRKKEIEIVAKSKKATLSMPAKLTPISIIHKKVPSPVEPINNTEPTMTLQKAAGSSETVLEVIPTQIPESKSSQNIIKSYTMSRPQKIKAAAPAIRTKEACQPAELFQMPIKFADNEMTLNEEPSFDSEVSDTLKQLALLLASNNLDNSRKQEDLVPGEVVDGPNRFEAFMVAVSVPEEMVEIETIIEVADKQPLADTLVQLAVYFAEKTDDGGITEKATVIKELVQEIFQELESTALLDLSEVPEKPPLTPEITEKLLQLLSALGYQNPKEVLLEFVEKYDLEFLLHSIKYLYQLMDNGEQQEFMTQKISKLITTDNAQSTKQRIGKIIFSLINMNYVRMESSL